MTGGNKFEIRLETMHSTATRGPVWGARGGGTWASDGFWAIAQTPGAPFHCLFSLLSKARDLSENRSGGPFVWDHSDGRKGGNSGRNRAGVVGGEHLLPRPPDRSPPAMALR